MHDEDERSDDPGAIEGGKRSELARLLALYREGSITEDALVERIERLDRAGAAEGWGGPAADEALIATLDAFRAAEASGAEVLRVWGEMSADAALVGGLRTAAAREAKHAALLDQRVRELGGRPCASIPDWLAAFNARIADPDCSDLERLQALAERFEDPDAAVKPVYELIDSIEDDDLTCELLRTICIDELSTVHWLHEALVLRRDRAD